MVAFILGMSNIGSWNNQWSGSDRLYCRVCHNNYVPKSLVGNTYYYNFGDGWTASIEVKKMPCKEAREMEKRSCGFYGYDWMIRSLIKNGEIKKED